MDLTRFFMLGEGEMSCDDAVAATTSVQMGQSSGVFLHCIGGTVGSFMQNAEAMASQRFTALGLLVGSLALDFYLCAETRLALPSSIFHLHHTRIRWEDGERETLDQLLWRHEISRALMETRPMSSTHRKAHQALSGFIQLVADSQHFGVRWAAKRTGLEAGVVDRLMYEEVTLTAHEALHLGIVHRIIGA